MRIVLLIFAVLFMLLNLWGYKSYFHGTGKMQAELDKSRADLRAKSKNDEDVFVGALIVLIGVEEVLRIVFFIVVATTIGRGWLMFFAVFNAVWDGVTLLPTLINIANGKVKRRVVDIVLTPLNTVFLAYLIWLFVR